MKGFTKGLLTAWPVTMVTLSPRQESLTLLQILHGALCCWIQCIVKNNYIIQIKLFKTDCPFWSQSFSVCFDLVMINVFVFVTTRGRKIKSLGETGLGEQNECHQSRLRLTLWSILKNDFIHYHSSFRKDLRPWSPHPQIVMEAHSWSYHHHLFSYWRITRLQTGWGGWS